MRITILNLNMGNLGSIPNILKRFQCEVVVTNRLEDIESAEKLIIPGVGAFDAAMEQLESQGLISILNQKVLKERIPVLGICLGMQLLANRSNEGKMPGLGWIPGQVIRFHFGESNHFSENKHFRENKTGQTRLKIPHMGWNHVSLNPNISLMSGYESDPRFYFIHSYHYDKDSLESNTEVALTDYGYTFPAIIQKDNILGTQFHPEKSHRFGLKLFENFIHFGSDILDESTQTSVSQPMSPMV